MRKEISVNIRNEARAITKLCQPGCHSNIVSVFRHGDVVDAPFYYIDMELCVWNLEYFMHQENNGLKRLSMQDVWDIMTQIASGVVFIHEQREIHRDLKPRNGMSLVSVAYRA